MSFYGGHDAAFCVYQSKEDKFYTFELEKMLGIKHFSWAQDSKSNTTYKINTDYVMREFSAALDRAGIEKEFKQIINGSYWYTLSRHKFKYHLDPELLIQHRFSFDNMSFHRGHHLAHAWCALGQVPPSKGVIVTTDGGGDDGFFTVSVFDRSKNKFKRLARTQEREWKIGGVLEMLSHQYLDSIEQNTPHSADLAGKIMGMAGFGSPVPLKPTEWYNESSTDAYKNKEYNAATSYYGETNRYRFMNRNHLTFQEEANRCASIQKRVEELFRAACFELVPDFKTLLAEHDNQLVMSGGVSLNIINNAKIAKEFNCDVWVPPNPGDNGLAFGMLYKWLCENKIIRMNTDKRYDNSFIGPKIKDLNNIKNHRKIYGNRSYEVTENDLVDFLKAGEVIGLMQGSSETGFRALGNRSILCDASFPGIKIKVNEIKKREKYRPFAPVCLWEDAQKWFDVGLKNIYRHMNTATTVKPEYKHQLESITHIDGTARLQAIDQEGFLYRILKQHGGVLLNTSFNLGGKPICNSLFEALHILERSKLDKLIIENKDGNLICFEHHRNEIV